MIPHTSLMLAKIVLALGATLFFYDVYLLADFSTVNRYALQFPDVCYLCGSISNQGMVILRFHCVAVELSIVSYFFCCILSSSYIPVLMVVLFSFHCIFGWVVLYLCSISIVLLLCELWIFSSSLFDRRCEISFDSVDWSLRWGYPFGLLWTKMR